MSIEAFMEKASEAYYAGNPLITNEEYDALEKTHGQIIKGDGDIPHKYRMFSLKKHYDTDGAPPLPASECIDTPKLDGAAISLLFLDGKLELALTRGNGILGRDITDKLELLCIPNLDKQGSVQVTGEVVALKDLPNSRNYASGALNLKSLEEFEGRISEGRMIFVAYGIQESVGDTYEDDMLYLQNLGFHTVLDTFLSDKYPTDGVVYRLNDNSKFNELGFTDKFPRGAFAFKTQKEYVKTKLINVIWNTGKSGKVTPIAILEPVEIEGAKVAKATLNNIEYIESLGLEIGCTVHVIRSGEIIPKIVGRD